MVSNRQLFKVVRCDYEPLKQRVESVLELAMTTVDSLSKLFVSPPREGDIMNPFTMLDASDEKKTPLALPPSSAEIDVDVKDDESKTMSSGLSESIPEDAVKVEDNM